MSAAASRRTSCPPWCVEDSPDPDNPRDPDPIHRGPSVDIGDPEGPYQRAIVQLEQYDDAGTRIRVRGDAELTLADARRLAVRLLLLVEEAEGVS